MNCVFHAYCDHLRHIGVTPTMVDWTTYQWLKAVTHGTKPQPTQGGMVPFIIRTMARIHHLDVTVQHRLMTKAHHLYEAQNWRQRLIIKRTYYGDCVDPPMLAPAIYLLAGSQHAMFSTDYLYLGVPTIALQLTKGE